MNDSATPGDAGVLEPPDGLAGRLRFLGPGLVVSASLVGSGELVATTKLGAEAGFALLWLIVLGCVLKVFVQIEIARYAIATGETTLSAFDRVPGPRLGANWVLWLYVLATGLTYAALGGVLGAITQAVALGVAAPPRVVAVGVALFTVALLVLGRYGIIERTATVLVVAFTAMTVATVAALPATPFPVGLADLGAGFAFRLPADGAGLTTALGAFGLIGITGAELVSYPYWCVEKGYARFAGRPDGDPGWVARARGWIAVMRTDALVALAIYTASTAAFYLLGAAVLHRQGLNPDGLALVATLAEAYVPVFGGLARWLFVVGAIAVLYSTYLVAIAASTRTLTDFAGVMGWVQRGSPEGPPRLVAWLGGLLPLCTLGVFLTGLNPVGLIVIGGIAQALFLPVAACAVLYLSFRHTDRRLRSGRAWNALLVASSASLALVGGVGLARALG